MGAQQRAMEDISEEFSDGSEQPEAISEAKWAIEGSIYSDAIVYPLCDLEQGVNWGERNHYIGTTILLLWNYFMQATVCYLLSMSVGRSTVLPDLFQTESPDVADHRWLFTAPHTKQSGVCSLRPWNDFDPIALTREQNRVEEASFDGNNSAARLVADGSVRGLRHRRLWEPAADTVGGSLVGLWWLDCRPDMVQYLTAWDHLDINGDGHWTHAEAALINVRVARMFTHWMSFLRSTDAYAGGRLYNSTQNFTLMTRNVFESQDYLFIVCGSLSPAKCSSLEERHVLEYIYPHIDCPLDRITECEEMVSRTCRRILMADYRIYTIRHSQICGKEVASRAVSGNLTFKKTDYAEVILWNNLIRSNSFAVFIVLILIVWWLAVFAEMRAVFLMAEMLWLFPGPSSFSSSSATNSFRSGDDDSVDESPRAAPAYVKNLPDGTTSALCFSRNHRLYVACCVLMPRAFIACFLARVGSAFLATAQSFHDAILNSLALTFVLDMDEMLYVGVLSYRRKEIIANFEPLTIPYSVVGRDCGAFSPTIVYCGIILGTTVFTMLVERNMPYGWVYKAEALACFCDLQGPSCRQFWELESTTGLASSSAELEVIFGEKWWPRLPGWI